MKRIVLILMLMGVVTCEAQILDNVTTPSTDYCALPGQYAVDHVYLFNGLQHAQFATRNQQVADWYELPSTTPVSTNCNVFLNVRDGYAYRVVQNGQAETFAVFDYTKYRMNLASVTAQMMCDATTLNITGVPVMMYKDSNAVYQYIDRKVIVRYQNAEFSESEWKSQETGDTIIQANLGLVSLPKILVNTSFTLTDVLVPDWFRNAQDSVVTDTYEAIAVGLQLQSFTTTRGEKVENENMRPIKEDQISGSAPLNMLFKSNPSPMVEYYTWQIERGSTPLSTRTEKDIRYVFEEPAIYSVKLEVGNSDSCHCDTTLSEIQAHTSLLLVPNVFSPNGDGVNDEFRVAYRSLATFRCWVFNRWQHLIYSWTDPAKGWNGTIHGAKAPDGAYYYYIEAVGTDGVKYKRKGAVNLLRGK